MIEFSISKKESLKSTNHHKVLYSVLHGTVWTSILLNMHKKCASSSKDTLTSRVNNVFIDTTCYVSHVFHM